MDLATLPKIIRPAYLCDIPWSLVPRTLDRWTTHYGLNMDRASSLIYRSKDWEQPLQEKYVEWGYRGGWDGFNIFFNCPGWNTRTERIGPLRLIDGYQRLLAVRQFFNDAFPIHNYLYSQFRDTGTVLPLPKFTFWVADIDTDWQLYVWYLELNGYRKYLTEDLDIVAQLLKEKLSV